MQDGFWLVEFNWEDKQGNSVDSENIPKWYSNPTNGPFHEITFRHILGHIAVCLAVEGNACLGLRYDDKGEVVGFYQIPIVCLQQAQTADGETRFEVLPELNPFNELNSSPWAFHSKEITHYLTGEGKTFLADQLLFWEGKIDIPLNWFLLEQEREDPVMRLWEWRANNMEAIVNRITSEFNSIIPDGMRLVTDFEKIRDSQRDFEIWRLANLT